MQNSRGAPSPSPPIPTFNYYPLAAANLARVTRRQEEGGEGNGEGSDEPPEEQPDNGEGGDDGVRCADCGGSDDPSDPDEEGGRAMILKPKSPSQGSTSESESESTPGSKLRSKPELENLESEPARTGPTTAFLSKESGRKSMGVSRCV